MQHKAGDVDILYSYYKAYKRMPSYQEAADLFGFSSKNAAYKHIKSLIDQGYLHKDSKGKLLPDEARFSSVIKGRQVAILGVVEAGFGMHSEQEELDRTTLDEWMLAGKSLPFMLRVTGDSMKDAGILHDDMLLVIKTHKANVGDIVIAEIDGLWTVKYLAIDKSGSYFLKPANKDYKDLHPESGLRVTAKVIGVARRYE